MNKSGILFLFEYVWKKEKRYIIYSFLLQILTALIPLADIIIPKFIIDELVQGKRFDKVTLLIALLLGITLFGSYLVNFLSEKNFTLKGKIFVSFQADLAEKLSNCDFEQLESKSFLDTKAKAEKFLYANGQGFAGVLDSAFNILGKIFVFIGIIAIIATLNILIVLLFIGLILLNSWYESKVRKQYVSWDMEKAPVERRTSYLSDLVSNFAFGKEIRIFGIKNWLVEKIRSHLNESYEFYKKQTAILFKSKYIASIVNVILKGITYLYIAFQVIKGIIGIGDFTMYVTALVSFSSAMNDVMQSILDIRQFGGYYDALKEYMVVPQKMREGKSLSIPQGPYQIRFHNVSFQYAGQEAYALKNINIIIDAGKKLSVVGENGAGKTTFVKLLCRLYDPTEGSILLNGMDIRDINYDEYMGIIGSVFQDFKLLSFTLKENIMFDKSETAKDEEAIRLLEKSGFGHKIDTLTKGIHTNIYKNFEDSGFEPSGGEGQKIALARPLYKNSPIIILDEPTSALDPRAEYEMYKGFSEIVSGKTAVFISHRLSSSKFCDSIAVFKNGEIIEYGDHESLMQQQGVYSELFNMQAEYYI